MCHYIGCTVRTVRAVTISWSSFSSSIAISLFHVTSPVQQITLQITFVLTPYPIKHKHLTDPRNNQSPTISSSSTFFSEHLTAFELWLDFGDRGYEAPMHLPILLQVRIQLVYYDLFIIKIFSTFIFVKPFWDFILHENTVMSCPLYS